MPFQLSDYEAIRTASSSLSLFCLSVLTHNALPASKIVHPMALLAAFLAHRRPRPSRKAPMPSSRTISLPVDRMEADLVSLLCIIGDVCSLVLMMSKGWVISVASAPAKRPENREQRPSRLHSTACIRDVVLKTLTTDADDKRAT